jgi:uncharacterized Tic20 family protein
MSRTPLGRRSARLFKNGAINKRESRGSAAAAEAFHQAGNSMGNHNFINELLPQPGLRERQVAALAHASILAYLLGVATGPFWPCCIFPFIPVIILAYYKRKDKWVSFQAWQAVIFQLILFIGFLFIGVPAFLLVFARCAPGFGLNSSSCNDVFLPLTLVAVIALLIVPLGMVVFGLVRGILLLTGKDIEYPVISRLLRKWLKPEQN